MMRGIVLLLLLCNLLFPIEAFVSRRTTVGVKRQLYRQQKKCSPILSKKKNFNFKLFSQWMDDEEETTKKEADKMKAAVRRSPSYDEAGSTMEQEDDDAEMAQSGGNDFDTTDVSNDTDTVYEHDTHFLLLAVCLVSYIVLGYGRCCFVFLLFRITHF